VARATHPESLSRDRHRRAPHSIFTRVQTLIKESLFRNSAFLLINLVLGAACGYGSLSVLTHIFSVQTVGLSATAISACALVVSLMQFGMSYSLPRYLPTTAHRTALINTMLTMVIMSTMVGSVVFLALPFAKNLFALGGWVFGVVFVVTACVQAGEAVLQIVLVADRSSDRVAQVGAIPNVIKVAAPAALSFLGALGAFAARVVSDFFAFFVFLVVLARRGQRFRPTLSISATRDIRRFSAGMYVATIIGGLPNVLLPIIVLSRVGPKESAYWSIAISISYLFFQLPSAINQALLPELSHRATERRYLIRRSAFLIIVAVVPALAVAYIAAPIALAFFGHAYIAGSLAALRWLILAGFITMLNYVTGAILFIAKKSMLITVVNIIDAVIIFGLVILWATNVQEIAISWVIGDIANTVFFGFFAFLALREVGGRWADLGENQAARAVAAARQVQATRLRATLQQQALDSLAALAEQQQTAGISEPYRYTVTDPHGLFPAIALEAAERDMANHQNGKSPAADVALPGSQAAQQQALNALISMAKLQRMARMDERQGHPKKGNRDQQDPID
jgi:O-antigen/teichoic acid export membrane protein